MHINSKNIIYVKHSEAHTQLSHLMRLDESITNIISVTPVKQSSCDCYTARIINSTFILTVAFFQHNTEVAS